MSAPPENRSRKPSAPPALFDCVFSSWIALKSTYGTGMCDPIRKMKMMKIVKKILFRRSGTRNMFRRRESLTSPGPHGADDLLSTGIGECT